MVQPFTGAARRRRFRCRSAANAANRRWLTAWSSGITTHHTMRLSTFISTLAVMGTIGCASVHPQAQTSPDRHLTEVQALRLAQVGFPPQAGDSYHLNFKDGIWEVVCDSSNAQGHKTRVVKIRDADGKVVEPH